MSQVLLRSVALRQYNVIDASDWIQSNLPLPPGLQRSLQTVLETLAGANALLGVRIEEFEPTSMRWDIVGLGLSCFIQPELLNEYIQAPRAFVFVDILDRFRRDPEVMLDRRRIAQANAGDGLHLAVLYMQKGWDFSTARWRAVASLGHQTFVKYHAGYKLNRSIHEDWSAHVDTYLAAGYTAIATVAVDPTALPPTACQSGETRTLFLAEHRHIASRAPGSTLSHVFQTQSPRCFFTASEQDLLLRALEGATDQDMARAFELPLTTVKHHWRQIYQRVQEALPFVLGEDDDDGQRGPEKRRRVLAYVDEHPEELRPFERPGSRKP